MTSWQPSAEQSFTFSASSRIVVEDDSLRAEATTLAEDLTAQTGFEPAVVIGDVQALRGGDVGLAVSSGPENEHRLETADGMVTVSGSSRTAVFHGTRSALQLLRTSLTIPAGTAVDRPRYAERGLLIANAEKQFPLDWWQALIRELGCVKMNMLWVYVGYREAPLALMQEINQYAKRYHVELVPQYNMPGHFGRALIERPDLALPGQDDDLDLSKDESYAYTDTVVRSLAPEFDTRWWHAGSDEFLFGDSYDKYPQLLRYAREHYGSGAIAADVHYGFVNRLNAAVRAENKTLRIWNDGIFTDATVRISTDVVVEHWLHKERSKRPSQLLREGYQLHNANIDYLYHDLGWRHVDPVRIYEQFRPTMFHGETVPGDPARIRGAKLHVWTLPDAETPDEVLDGLFAPIRSLAQVLWGSPTPSPSFAGFAQQIATLGWAPQNWTRVTAETAQRACRQLNGVARCYHPARQRRPRGHALGAEPRTCDGDDRSASRDPRLGTRQWLSLEALPRCQATPFAQPDPSLQRRGSNLTI